MADHQLQVVESQGQLSLPNNWAARPYQKPLFNYMFVGGLDRKRALCVWHRRAGKDSCCLNLGAVASQMRVGTIWHMLPTLKQGRRVIWDGIDKFGRRMIDQAFPKEIRASKNDSEMQIRLKNGSIWQVVGSDNYDSLVGTNPVGVIFSEYSVADPTAWDYIRPILAENGGWAMFIYTPRGKNHGKMLYEATKDNPKWFSNLLTVNDTYDEEGKPIILPEHIQEERESGMSSEKIAQEFMCSWDAGMEGAFYTEELNLAEKEGRIGDFPHDPMKQCQTWWDIGFRDNTAVIITQRGEDGKPVIIDYVIDRNKPLDFYIRELRSKPYTWEEPHWGPHDMSHHDWTTGKTRIEFAQSLNFKFDVVENIPRAEGIDAARAMIRICKFNKGKVEMLLDALMSYKREWDDKRKQFKDTPYHDWASNGADSFRYMSVGWQDYGPSGRPKINPKRHFKVKRAVRRSK